MLLNYKKHTRTPSQIEISEFKAFTKLDASQTLQKELQKLLLTAPNSETDVKS
jgi:thermostable 8-oxoguanine DNA glycosylase